MGGFSENIYQLFVAILFLAYAFICFQTRSKVPIYRRWIKLALAVTGIIGFIFYFLLGTDFIDLPVMAEMRRLCMRGILTVWLTLLISDEMRIRRA
jgi:hypothetical protein